MRDFTEKLIHESDLTKQIIRDIIVIEDQLIDFETLVSNVYYCPKMVVLVRK